MPPTSCTTTRSCRTWSVPPAAVHRVEVDVLPVEEVVVVEPAHAGPLADVRREARARQPARPPLRRPRRLDVARPCTGHVQRTTREPRATVRALDARRTSVRGDAVTASASASRTSAGTRGRRVHHDTDSRALAPGPRRARPPVTAGTRPGIRRVLDQAPPLLGGDGAHVQALARTLEVVDDHHRGRSAQGGDVDVGGVRAQQRGGAEGSRRRSRARSNAILSDTPRRRAEASETAGRTALQPPQGPPGRRGAYSDDSERRRRRPPRCPGPALRDAPDRPPGARAHEARARVDRLPGAGATTSTPGLARGLLDLVEAGPARAAWVLARSDVRWLEVNRPLMVSSLRRSALALADRRPVAARAAATRALVVTYAIANDDPFRPPARRVRLGRVRRWLDARLIARVAGRVDRVVFGTPAAQEYYGALVPGCSAPKPCCCRRCPRRAGAATLDAKDAEVLPSWGRSRSARACREHFSRRGPRSSRRTPARGSRWSARAPRGRGARVRRRPAGGHGRVDPPRAEVHAHQRRAAVAVLLSQRTHVASRVGLPVVEARARLRGTPRRPRRASRRGSVRTGTRSSSPTPRRPRSRTRSWGSSQPARSRVSRGRPARRRRAPRRGRLAAARADLGGRRWSVGRRDPDGCESPHTGRTGEKRPGPVDPGHPPRNTFHPQFSHEGWVFMTLTAGHGSNGPTRGSSGAAPPSSPDARGRPRSPSCAGRPSATPGGRSARSRGSTAPPGYQRVTVAIDAAAGRV